MKNKFRSIIFLKCLFSIVLILIIVILGFIGISKGNTSKVNEGVFESQQTDLDTTFSHMKADQKFIDDDSPIFSGPFSEDYIIIWTPIKIQSAFINKFSKQLSSLRYAPVPEPDDRIYYTGEQLKFYLDVDRKEKVLEFRDRHAKWLKEKGLQL